MPEFTNKSPLGALEIPDLGITVAEGETFEVEDLEIAAGLAAQPSNFETDWEPPAPAQAEEPTGGQTEPAAPAKAARKTTNKEVSE